MQDCSHHSSSKYKTTDKYRENYERIFGKKEETNKENEPSEPEYGY